jgi:two-component system LytT family sensor kinase
VLAFADYVRSKLARAADFVTLEEELRHVQSYLELEQARFGDQLVVTIDASAEALAARLPAFLVQPLVENAVKHGLEGTTDKRHISITAQDAGAEALVVIEDDGAGMDPELLRRILAGEVSPSGGIGLSNVDDRLRQVYGDDHGLVIETAPGAGMKITTRLPKYQPGVHSAGRLPRP